MFALISLSFAVPHSKSHAGGRSTHGVASPARARRLPRGPESDPLANAVVVFAQHAIGQQVGNGECYDLADQALRAAGAHSAPDFTAVNPEGDYVWGRPVPLSTIRPGDILQFRDFRIIRRYTYTLRGQDGSFESQQSERFEDREHHTAIVEQVNGGTLTVLEQNMDPGGRVVQRNSIDIVPHTDRVADLDGRETTTETSVEGAIEAYRPVRATVVSETAKSGL